MMKKYISILIFTCFSGLISTAQVQRTPAKQKTDTLNAAKVSEKNRDSRKEMFRELDLSKEQKIKMKELNQSMKASREAIENDSTLSETEKKAKLKTLRKEQVQKIQALLTEEQKVKFRELKARKDEEGS